MTKRESNLLLDLNLMHIPNDENNKKTKYQLKNNDKNLLILIPNVIIDGITQSRLKKLVVIVDEKFSVFSPTIEKIKLFISSLSLQIITLLKNTFPNDYNDDNLQMGDIFWKSDNVEKFLILVLFGTSSFVRRDKKEKIYINNIKGYQKATITCSISSITVIKCKSKQHPTENCHKVFFNVELISCVLIENIKSSFLLDISLNNLNDKIKLMEENISKLDNPTPIIEYLSSIKGDYFMLKRILASTIKKQVELPKKNIKLININHISATTN